MTSLEAMDPEHRAAEEEYLKQFRTRWRRWLAHGFEVPMLDYQFYFERKELDDD